VKTGNNRMAIKGDDVGTRDLREWITLAHRNICIGDMPFHLMEGCQVRFSGM
jgi:hypothetical protein